MPRVLVLGATGYLGNSVALTLLRTGLHTVYGLTRSEKSGKPLTAAEITPIVCPDPANDPSPYVNAIKNNRIDVVIDCTAAYGDSVKFFRTVYQLSSDRLDTFEKEGVERGPKMGYIYVSGAWVHGDSAGEVTDRDAVGTSSAKSKPADLVAWRPEIEREILGARNNLDVLIFRPATLYGRSSSGWGGLFQGVAQAVQAGKGEMELPLRATAKAPTVHVDDVADAIARGVERIESLSCYPIFDLVGHQEKVVDVLNAFANAIGDGKSSFTVKLTAKSAGESGDAFMEAMASTVNYTSARAKQYLGWEAKRPGLEEKMAVYAKAFAASY